MAHESTTAYLAVAEAQRTGAHASLRTALRTINTALSQLQAGVAAQRGAFGDMQLDETDPLIVGVFAGQWDIMKTLDRLTAEASNSLVQLPAVLDRDEEITARISGFLNPPAPA